MQLVSESQESNSASRIQNPDYTLRGVESVLCDLTQPSHCSPFSPRESLLFPRPAELPSTLKVSSSGSILPPERMTDTAGSPLATLAPLSWGETVCLPTPFLGQDALTGSESWSQWVQVSSVGGRTRTVCIAPSPAHQPIRHLEDAPHLFS